MKTEEDKESGNKYFDRAAGLILPLGFLFGLICMLVDGCSFVESGAELVKEKKYKLVSQELGLREKDVVIEHGDRGTDKVLTNKGTYNVIFNTAKDPDNLEIKHIRKH